MGIGQSREADTRSVEEASETRNGVNNLMDASVTENPMEDPKNSNPKKEQGKRAEVTWSTEEEPKKSKEELRRPMEVTRRTVDEPNKSKEVVEKYKEVVEKAKEVIRKPMEEAKKEVIRKPMEEAKKVPHKYEAIMKEADKPLSGGLNDHIHSGIFLNNKRKKFWVEERTGHNCFMVFARDLLITWSKDQRFWQWNSLKETNDVEIEVAKLINVCWLEVHGRFETSYLTPRIPYEVIFVVMMTEGGYGWDVPVNLRLTLADGSKQQHKECLDKKPRGQWIELKAGEFTTRPDQAGETEFSLFEYQGGDWKRGLVVKGVIIRPKK